MSQIIPLPSPVGEGPGVRLSERGWGVRHYKSLAISITVPRSIFKASATSKGDLPATSNAMTD